MTKATNTAKPTICVWCLPWIDHTGFLEGMNARPPTTDLSAVDDCSYHALFEEHGARRKKVL